MSGRLVIGTRGSKLALWQSQRVAFLLTRAGRECELKVVRTSGDERPADTLAGEGVFVTELEAALRAGEVDLAVHSAKDLPTRPTPGLLVAAHPERADPADALVAAKASARLAALPRRARVGTDSPRRRGFLLHLRPDLQILPLSGNVDSRLRRLESGEIDAVVLAAAGLERLGLAGRIGERLDPRTLPPAPAQGALAIQCRSSDSDVRSLLEGLDNEAVSLAVLAERTVLEVTGGGCRTPLGALASLAGGRLRLVAGMVEPDGSRPRFAVEEEEASAEGALRAGERAGRALAAPQEVAG